MRDLALIVEKIRDHAFDEFFVCLYSAERV
jgi:hypothetical protein